MTTFAQTNERDEVAVLRPDGTYWLCPDRAVAEDRARNLEGPALIVTRTVREVIVTTPGPWRPAS